MSTHAVSFSDEAGPSSPRSAITSSPSRVGRSSANGGRDGIVPLGAAKTVAALTTRRGVIFSPANETRTFDLNDSILPLKDAPPPSIRSYALSDPICSSSPAPSSSRCGTPISVRSILKSRAASIRVAASVEEGTLQNKEPARLLVSGQRPRLLARDSFQLAAMRTAAADGMVADKGKGKAVAGSDEAPASEDLPGSDDSAASDDAPGGPAQEGSSEMEEEIEEPGLLAPTSLIGIILDGAEDLLTLEEAYAVLNVNLRTRIPTNVPIAEWPAVVRQELQVAVAPIRDEAPAMVRAMQRDLQRVLGKIPGIEAGSSTRESSPFRGLMPLRDTTRSRMTPSPTPVPSSKRLDNSGAKKGYTEAEVRYRREAAGVGAATLRFIALVMHVPALYGCFSETDMTSLLDLVLSILRTPSLPTPNPKRTYYTALTVLGGLKIFPASVLPLKEKIARALESALTDGLGLGQGSPTAKDSGGQIKKESHIAAVNLFSTYPTIFLSHHAEFLPTTLRGLHSALPLTRMRSSALLAAITTAKLNALSDTTDRETWTKNKVVAQKLELFVVSHLRSVVRSKAAPVYTATGEKKTEWNELERVFKETVGNANDVTWACATWSAVVCLMGSAYASSGLASSFDHIMDRSLQPSTNVVRPLLARVAWSHAIYAYLSAGSAVSMSDDGKIVASYKPFPTSASGEHTERIRTIQMPVDLALSLALDPQNFSRVEKDGRWAWQRVEKAKKFQWLNTCGLGAAAVVFAYSGMALYHQDQPAKEMMALSGLPSSDGAAIPDSARDEATLERLDRTWERVVRPLIKSLGSVCAVDRVKVHGWGIFDAIISQTPGTSSAEAWSLDRLISAKFVNGDLFNLDKADKEDSIDALLETVDKESIRPNEIPAWGSSWIVRRIDRVLALFEDLLTGIGGLAEPELLRWTGSDNAKLIPANFSRMWTNILRAVAAHPTDTPEYTMALTLITRHLLQVFNRDPTTHVPVSSLRVDGTIVTDADTLRLGLFAHLLHLTLEILGPEVVGATRMKLGPGADKVDTVIFHTSFGSTGSDGAKEATMAGCLLGQLVRAQVLSFPLQPAAMASFKLVLETVVKAGATPGFSAKLLGDLTNAMPFIFHDQEEPQLVVWRVLAATWVTFLDAQYQTQTTTSSSTNHTGALLVSLLSCPFRDRAVTSAWHQKADLGDLRTWQSLLTSTVQRFRARQVGPNFGVLESLAGHLGDFLESNDKTSSTTITLSCLASAMRHMRFADTPMGRHDDHYGVNESFVPRDFLAVVSGALLESYPRPESLGSVGAGEGGMGGAGISPAVFDLLKAIREVVVAMPAGVVGEVVSEVKDALAVWMRDDLHLVREADAMVLDELYVSLLATLGSAIHAGSLPSNAQTMDDLIDLFAPRLNRGLSAAVPTAFKTFYEDSFANVHAGEMSERVRAFVEEVVAAMLGMIEVPGLQVQDTFSQEESQARFPHALEAVPPGEFVPVNDEPVGQMTTVDATAKEAALPEVVSASINADIIPTAAVDGDVTMEQEAGQEISICEEYDADVSQTQTQVVVEVVPKRSARARRASRKAAAALTPIASETEVIAPSASEAVHAAAVVVAEVKDVPTVGAESAPATEDSEDVFGPTSRRIAKAKKGRGKGKKRASSTRQSGDSESLPVPKRAKTVSPPLEADTSHSLPLPALFTPLAASLSRDGHQADEEEEEDCILVYQSPPSLPPAVLTEASTSAKPVPQKTKARSQSRARLSAQREVIDMSETPDSDREEESAQVSPLQSQFPSQSHPASQQLSQASQNDLHPRPSLLTSAKGWLARVPSLFSPTTVVQPIHPAQTSDADVDTADIKADRAEGEVAEQLQVDVESASSDLKSGRPRREGWDEEQRRWVDRSGVVMTPGLLARLKARHASKEATAEEKDLYRRWKGYDLEPRLPARSESVSRSARSTPSVESSPQSLGDSEQGQNQSQIQSQPHIQSQGSSGRRQKKKRGRKAGNANATATPAVTAALPAAPVELIKSEPVTVTRPAATSPKRKAAAIVEMVEDDEDELLLSPESARKRRKEEEGDIAAAVERHTSQPASPAALRTRSKQKQPEQDEAVEIVRDPAAASTSKLPRLSRAKRTSQASLPSIASQLSQVSHGDAHDELDEHDLPASGQFEDAEESQRSQRRQAAAAAMTDAGVLPPTPVHRTAQQTRLLKMVEDASKAEQAVNNLDAAGVWELLRNIDTLRDAAQRNLKGKWEADRAKRRTGKWCKSGLVTAEGYEAEGAWRRRGVAGMKTNLASFVSCSVVMIWRDDAAVDD